MPMRVACSIALLSCSAEAFQVPVRPGALASARHAAPAMQFGFSDARRKENLPKGWKKVPSNSRPGQFSYLEIKTGKRYDRAPMQNVYDDEEDTYASRFAFWKPDAPETSLDDVEAAGFAPGGKDLANDGLYLYAAFIPFLLFCASYFFGLFGDGYGRGNF